MIFLVLCRPAALAERSERSDRLPSVARFADLSPTTQDQKLRTALQDYENEKWRIVANKVGTGFTPAACRERATQLIGGTL